MKVASSVSIACLASCLWLLPPALRAQQGSLDSSFGAGGKVTTPYTLRNRTQSSTDARAYSVTVQPDGKIMAAGYCYTGNPSDDFALVRYNTDGTIDTGMVTTDFAPAGTGGYTPDTGVKVMLQPDGKVLLAGYTELPGHANLNFALARYNTDLSLDPTFNGTGLATTDIANGWNSQALGAAVQSDGKIVLVGTAGVDSSNTPAMAVARYNMDGSLDTSFNGSGQVITRLAIYDYACGVAIQRDGKIVVVGTTAGGAQDALAILRYNTNGTLDTSFNGTGVRSVPVGTGGINLTLGVALQNDGKIVVGLQHSGVGNSPGFGVVRCNTDGSLDTSFGSSGVATTSVPGGFYGANLALQSNGKIVLAGTTTGDTSDFEVLRYTASGVLDTTFGGTGKVVTDFGAHDYPYGVALQSDGKIVVAGYSGFLLGGTNQFSFIVARYWGDGPGPLAAWRQQYYNTTNSAGNAADTATPDNDGITNLVKYGLVLAPGTPGAKLLPQPQMRTYAEGNRLAFIFSRDPTHNDIIISVQAADSPAGPWTTVASSAFGAAFSGAGFVSETNTAGGLKTVEVRDTINTGSASRRFMRIQVSR